MPVSQGHTVDVTNYAKFLRMEAAAEDESLVMETRSGVFAGKFRSICVVHLSYLVDLPIGFLRDSDNPDLTGDPGLQGGIQSPKRPSRLCQIWSPLHSWSRRKNAAKKRKPVDRVAMSTDDVDVTIGLIQYLSDVSRISADGIFRKTGQLARQRLLMAQLDESPYSIDLSDFHINDVACVLKHRLKLLGTADSLFTDTLARILPAIVDLTKPRADDNGHVVPLTEDDLTLRRAKQLTAYRILLLLLPLANYAILRVLLHFLHAVSARAAENRMNAAALATVFVMDLATSRDMSDTEIRTHLPAWQTALSYLIEHADAVFRVPLRLGGDIRRNCAQWRRQEQQLLLPTAAAAPCAAQNTGAGVDKQTAAPGETSVLMTGVYFTDQKPPPARTAAAPAEKNGAGAGSGAAERDAEFAIAELYAQLQEMPESAKKVKLIRRFNHLNGGGVDIGAGSGCSGGDITPLHRRQQRRYAAALQKIAAVRGSAQKPPSGCERHHLMVAAAATEQPTSAASSHHRYEDSPKRKLHFPPCTPTKTTTMEIAAAPPPAAGCSPLTSRSPACRKPRSSIFSRTPLRSSILRRKSKPSTSGGAAAGVDKPSASGTPYSRMPTASSPRYKSLKRRGRLSVS